MRHLLAEAKPAEDYHADARFLATHVWPRMLHRGVLQHDAFSCHHFPGALPFPTPRRGGEHVGAVFLDGRREIRQADVDDLLKATPPDQCLPKTRAAR